jgi:glutaredoxin
MRILLRLTLVCLFLLSSGSDASSQVYKWRDKDGNLIISTTPPPPGVQSEKRATSQSQRAEADAERSDASRGTGEEVELSRSYRDIKVIMYITDWCPYCKKASAYLKSLDVDLTEYDVEKDPEKSREYLEKGNNKKGVPLIDIEGIVVRGFDKDGISAALNKRRHAGFQY